VCVGRACCAQGIATQHVSAAIQLEQWLMEGAYNKVGSCKLSWLVITYICVCALERGGGVAAVTLAC
jgi:hypothetical protein